MSYNSNFTTAGIKLNIDMKDAFKDVKDTSSFLDKRLNDMALNAENFSARWGSMTKGIKDTKRIVSGIMISRSFYTLAETITGVSGEIFNFARNMETAAISMEYFIKNADKSVNAAAKSQAYLLEINEFAARTPFTTETTLNLSRYIQTMGLGIETTRSFFGVMADAASATGGTEDQLNRAVIAMGRMKAKGRITAREIRQLAAANIPIYQILQDELGLTGEQVANLGESWVAADKAIVAILRGLEKRYEGAADRVSETVTGMFNTVADNTKILGEISTEGLYKSFSKSLGTLRDALEHYREIAVESGSGGLFTQILMDLDASGQVGTRILMLVGTFKNLGQSLKETYIAAQPLRTLIGTSLYASVTVLANGVVAMSKIVTQAAAAFEKMGITGELLTGTLASLLITYKVGSWMAFLGQGASAAAWAMINAAKGASMMLPAFMQARMGVVALTAGMAGLLIYALATKGVFDMISGSMAGLNTQSTNSSGLPDDYMSEYAAYAAKFKEYNDQIKEYSDSFAAPYTELDSGAIDAVDGLEDIEKASSKAAKAVKNDWLAAFDEVYAIPKDNAAGGVLDELPTLDMGLSLLPPMFNFPSFDGEPFEVPKFSLDDLFGGTVWDIPESELVTNSSLKALLPFAAMMLAGKLASAFSKQPLFNKKPTPSGSPGGVGAGSKSPAGIGAMAAKEAVEELKKIKETIKERMLNAQAALEALDNPKLDMIGTERRLEILDDTIKKLTADIKTANLLNLAGGNTSNIVFSDYEKLVAAADKKRLESLRKILSSMQNDIIAGINVLPLDKMATKMEAINKSIVELVTKTSTPESLADSIAKLVEQHGNISSGIAAKTPDKILAGMVNTFNRDTKELFSVIEKLGEGVISPEQNLILDELKNIQKYTVGIDKHLKFIADTTDEMNRIRAHINNLNAIDQVSNAAAISTLKAEEAELGKAAAKATSELIKFKNHVKLASSEVVKKLQADADAARAEKQIQLDKEAFEKRIKNNKIEAEKAEIKEQKRLERERARIETEKNISDRTKNRLIEDAKAYETTQGISGLRLKELVDRAEIIGEEIKALKDVFDDKSPNYATEKQLKQMAEKFGVEVTKADRSIVSAYARKISSLEAQLVKLNTAAKNIEATFDKTAEINKFMYKAFKNYVDTSVPDIPKQLLPNRDFTRPISSTLANLDKEFKGLSDALKTTGTKVFTLRNGINEYGTSVPEMVADVLNKYGVKALNELTSRNNSAFIQSVQAMGTQMEDVIAAYFNERITDGSKLFRGAKGDSLLSADGLINAQIDTYIKDKLGNLFTTDIKTISGPMREALFGDDIGLTIEKLAKFRKEWYNQFAAQVYALYGEAGGKMGVITFNRDFDFGKIIAKRFQETFNVGELGNIFNIDTMHKATMGKHGAKVVEEYLEKLFSNVLKDPVTGAIDAGPLYEAMDHGVVKYSKALLKTFELVDTAADFEKYVNMISPLIGASNLGEFLHTYVAIETSMGEMIKAVNFANIPRIFTAASKSTNKWLQTILDDTSIKTTRSLKSPNNMLQKYIDKIITDFNENLDLDKFRKSLGVLQLDLNILGDIAAGTLDVTAMDRLSDELGYITSNLEGTVGDFRLLSKALDEISSTPNSVKNAGRIIRSVIEQTNSINLRIAEGIEVTADELWGVTRNIRKLIDTFELGTDRVFRDTLNQLSDMSQAINKVGKAAILEVSQQIELPIRTLGIKESIGYAAYDISKGIRDSFKPLIEAKGSVEAGTAAWNEFLTQVSDIELKRVPTLDTTIKRLEGSFKRLLIDVEATSLELEKAQLVQLAVKDITPGSSGEEFITYINRGEKTNAKLLEAMQSIIDVNEKQADTKFYLKKIASIADDIKSENRSIQGIIRDMQSAPKADPRILRLADKLIEITKEPISRDEIIAQAEYWARLTDVSKQFLNVSVEQLNAGVTIAEAAAKLSEMTGGSPAEFVGHNVFQYDIPVLESIKEFASIDFTHFVDTLQLARATFKGTNFESFSKSLGNLYEVMIGGPTAGAHDAGVDINMTESIFNAFESGLADGVSKAIDAAITSGIKLDKGKMTEVFKVASGATDSGEALSKAIVAINAIIEASYDLDKINASKLTEAATTFGKLAEGIAVIDKIKGVPIQAIDETVNIIPKFTTLFESLSGMFKSILKTETVFNEIGGFARATTIGGSKFSVGKATLGMTGPNGEAMDGAAKFFARFGSASGDAKLISINASTISKSLNILAGVGRFISAIGEVSDAGRMRKAYDELTTGFTANKFRQGDIIEKGVRVRNDADLLPDFAPINKDMTTLLDRALSIVSIGILGTRSGAASTAKKYFDLPEEMKALYGQEYFSGDNDWREGALGGGLIGRGSPTETYTQSVLTRKPGFFVGKVKDYEAEQYLQSQIGSGSPFEAIMDYIVRSGDTESDTAKTFYDKYGAYVDSVIKPAYGMGADWNESANTLIAGMGKELNVALASAGLSEVKNASDIDISMKPYFDAMLNEIYDTVTAPALAQMALVDRNTKGTDLLKEDTSRVFESVNLADFNSSTAKILEDELGVTISKINDQFGKVSIDSDKLNENLTGWTQRLPEGLNFKGSSLTATDVSILSQAGIQVNGNGTVTFMKAMNEAMAGTSRDISLTIDDVSQDILTKLNAEGVNLSFGADGVASLDLGTAAISEQMSSVLFRLNKDLTGQVSDDMKEALSGLGNILDSGYVQITNEAVLNGTMTISEYIDSMGDGAKKLSPELRKTLEILDDVIAQGGDVTRETIATWADGVVMPSPIDKSALTLELEEAFASIGVTFTEEGGEFMMVVNKLGDDIKDGMTLIPKELWDKLDEDVVAGLRKMGVTITEEGGFVKVNLNTVLRELVDAESITPEIEASMDLIGASFVIEGGKIVGVVDDMGRDLTDNLLTIPTRIWEQVDPAVKEALETMGVGINTATGKVMIDFSKITETGIQDMVELYVNRPDLWNQIPEQVMQILQEANMMNNEGMFTIQADMLTGLIKIGEDWVGNWNKLPVETQKALGLTVTETDEGLFRVSKAAADAKIGEAIDGSVILPFEKLPQDLKDKLIGEGGSEEAMRESLIQISKTTSENLVPMNTAISAAFGQAADDASDGAVGIAEAVAKAIKSVNEMNNIEIDNQSIGSKIVNKVKNKPVSAKRQSDGLWTVTGGGKTYNNVPGRDMMGAIRNARQRAEELNLPSFKTGGLISSDGIYRAGEFGRTEAVLPLEDPAAMAQVGAAIAAHMPYSAVTELSGASIAMMVGKFQDVFTTEREKTELYNKELFDDLLVGISEYNDEILDTMLTFRDFETTIDNLSNDLAGALNDINTTIGANSDYIISAIQGSATNIAAAIENVSLSSPGGSGYDDVDTSGITVGDTGDTGKYEDIITNPLGMSISDFNRYLIIKEAAEYQHSQTGIWNADLAAQAQRLRDKYGITSDRYSYDDLKKYKGSARGSLITKDALYRAGEGGLNEAIIPLEQRDVLQKVGTAIASAMPKDIAAPLSQVRGLRDGGVRRQSDYRQEEQKSAVEDMTQKVLEVILPAIASSRATGNNNNDGDKRPLYVGTLIADERGLKELNKKLVIIEAQEKVRRG